MAGWRVDLGSGREPEDDVDRAPVLMMRPSVLSPKGMVRWVVAGESVLFVALVSGSGATVVLCGIVWGVAAGLVEAGAGAVEGSM